MPILKSERTPLTLSPLANAAFAFLNRHNLDVVPYLLVTLKNQFEINAQIDTPRHLEMENHVVIKI